MSEELQTIRLYGYLGTKFGRVHHFVVTNTQEAIRAMCIMIPGFERELMNSRDHGIAYACFVGKRNINQEQLQHPVGKMDIRIAPVIQGSKQAGLFQTIVGVIIIAIAYFNPFGFLTGPMVTAAYAMGVSMALGGVIQMLSPQQAGLSSKDGPANGASYNFNGPVNVEAQGNPESLLLGESWCGSVVVSGGMFAEDQA